MSAGNGFWQPNRVMTGSPASANARTTGQFASWTMIPPRLDSSA